MSMRSRLTREALANALENWLRLTYQEQLRGILSCAEFNQWTPEETLVEIRHWMSQISSEEQKAKWGSSLYGETEDGAAGDGEKMMMIIEHVWLGTYR